MLTLKTAEVEAAVKRDLETQGFAVVSVSVSGYTDPGDGPMFPGRGSYVEARAQIEVVPVGRRTPRTEETPW